MGFSISQDRNMKKQKFYKPLQKGAVCLFIYLLDKYCCSMLLFFVHNKEEFTIILLETVSSNDTHNVWVEKTSREEIRDAVTFHAAKVVATLSAPLRKDLASFLQELIPITRVYLQLTLQKSLLALQSNARQHRICTREGNRVKKGQPDKQTYNQPIFRMCSAAVKLIDTSSSSKPGRPQPLLL